MFFTTLDQIINTKIIIIQTNFLTKWMIFITNIISPSKIIIYTLIILAILFYQKRQKEMFLTIFAIILAYILEDGLKILIQRARPENALIEATSYSFPSGHATMAMVLFGLIIVLFAKEINTRIKRNIFITTNILLIIIVGFTRIYLNVHWFTDVIAGLIIGINIIFLTTYIIKKSKISRKITKKNF